MLDIFLSLLAIPTENLPFLLILYIDLLYSNIVLFAIAVPVLIHYLQLIFP